MSKSKRGFHSVAAVSLAIAIVLGFSIQKSWADLLITQWAQVFRYNQDTGSFIDVFIKPGSGGLNGATGLSYGPDGNVYIASFYSRNILRYNGKTGKFIDEFVSPGRGGLGAPNDVKFGPDGNLYVSDGFYGTNSVLRFDGKTGDFIDVFATGGGMQQPNRFLFGPDRNLFVGNATTSDVLRYHGDTGLPFPAPGKSGAIFVAGRPGPFNTELAFAATGDLFVVSGAEDDILRYNGKTGALLGPFGPSVIPGDIAFGPDHNFYLLSYFGGSVLRYDANTGALIDYFVSPGNGGFSGSLTFSPSKDQCKNGGWINFGFKNQGQCIKFARRQSL